MSRRFVALCTVALAAAGCGEGPDTAGDTTSADAFADTASDHDTAGDTTSPDGFADTTTDDAGVEDTGPVEVEDGASEDAEDALGDDTADGDADDALGGDAADAAEDDTDGASVVTCAPGCAPGACGVDDGCGGVCGCDAGEVCVAGLCGPPVAGDSCAAPIVLASDALPVTWHGDTGLASNQLALVEACGGALPFGAGSSDLVFRFTAPAAGVYPVTLTGFDAGLVAVSACAAALDTCLDAAEGAGDGEALALPLEAGEVVFLVVDGYADLSNVTGAFDLTVGPGCQPACGLAAGSACGEASDGCGGGCPCAVGLTCTGARVCAAPLAGDTCADALALAGPLPITVEGSTAGALGDDYAVCSGDTDAFGGALGDDASDLVFAFTPPADGDYVFAVPTALDGDPSLLSVVTDCADLAGTCVAAADLFTTEAGAITVPLVADTPYFVLVDGYLEAGPFTLVVDLAP